MTTIPTLISPTGLGLRGADAWGSGAWLARRGARSHLGVDFRAKPGQEIVMPCTARVVRKKYPYPGDFDLEGVLLDAGGWQVTLFYLVPQVMPGTIRPIGAVLGTAQDISKRYDMRMTPHVHLEVEAPSRRALPADWVEGKHYVIASRGRVMVDPGLLMRVP